MPKKPSAPENRQPNLVVPRDEAQQKIVAQISRGQAMLDKTIHNTEELSEAKAAYYKWYDYNAELLRRLFDAESIASEYTFSIGFVVGGEESFGERVDEHIKAVKRDIQRLESILERLELIPESHSVTTAKPAPTAGSRASREVFIVHGHDVAAKLDVASLVQKLDLTPIILHEQPDMGRTIIEKLEAHANVSFAVVLLTGDDEGRVRGGDSLAKRARQNVILELGYFAGKLGRAHVCTLYENGVEIPSDLLGVTYTQLDEGGAWKLKVAKEIKSAGIHVDMNKLA